MLYGLVFGLIYGLGLFILPFWAYRRGLMDGLAISKGGEIKKIKPKLPQNGYIDFQKKQESQANDIITSGINNIMTYKGDEQ